MKKLSLVVVLIVSAALTFYIAYRSYTSVNPLGAIKLNYNKDTIKEKADSLIHSVGLNVENNVALTTLQSNQLLVRTLYNEHSYSEVNQLLREQIPGYFWEITRGTQKDQVVVRSDEDTQKKNPSDNLLLDYDTRGNLLKFTKGINDSVKADEISEPQARRIAINFISKYSPINVVDTILQTGEYKVKGRFLEKGVQITERKNRTDFKFQWEAQSADIDKMLLMEVVVSGKNVSEYSLSFNIPEGIEKGDIFGVVTTIPFYLIIYVLIIILGYKRIRAYEINFRLAVIMGLIVGLLFSINLYTIISESTGLDLWLPLIATAIFFSAGVLLTWSVSETIAREVRKDKFISIDLLTKGYAFHSKVGKAGITGLIGGFTFYLVWTVILFISENMMQIRFDVKDSSSLLSQFYSISPALNVLNKGIYPQIYSVAVFCFFVFSGLRRRFNSLLILIPVCAVIWGIVDSNNIHPIYWGVITGVVMSGLFLLFFSYFDVLSTILALSVYNIINTGVCLFTSDNIYYQYSAYYLVLFLIMLSIFFIIGFFTKDGVTDYDSITPAFVKHITERQRLQRELEIARDVQMSFLPARGPQFEGLDTAAQCIPALEVGGDYYDFVRINEGRFGIIIGDVSGKGTQAAFHMILAKGFVKALSKTGSTASEFLIKINELFYENVERGTFISMIYGIFDVKEKTFTFSRAGHNPIIAKHSGKNEVEMLSPGGLALGLEKGTIFSKTIKEVKINTHPGDTFVFYTDGFTEARNKYKLEFTERKLTETISNYINLSAKDLLEKTIADVKTFTGKTIQHDDMTMVVVKVL